MDQTKPCAFCTLPNNRILDINQFGIVIRDGYPISPGHTLVISRRHVASFFELMPEEVTEMMSILKRTKDCLQTEFKPEGFNIGINDGEVAGQTVPHLHIHLIPRYKGDCTDPRGGVRWIIPEKANYWSSI
jgi:diadenosine tetraphosphate (Ap4A) HIT family hydrolase